MVRIDRRALAVPATVALTLVLTACGGGGSSSSGEVSYEDSPLNEIYSNLYSASDLSQEEQQAEDDEMNRRAEELTAECMADLGFEYLPQDYGGTVIVFDDEGEDRFSKEWAEQYGYGLTTWEDTPEGQQMSQQSEEVYEDPNQEIIESMSQAELDAWYAALYGEPDMTEYDPEAEASYEYNWEESGCSGAAQQQVYVDESPYGVVDSLYNDPQFAELFEGLNNLYLDTQNSPAMQEINQEWATCMADAGYPGIASPEEAQQSIMDQQDAAYQAAGEGVTEESEWVEPDFTDLKAEEIATATADYTCQDDTDYRDRALKVQFAIEQDFVDANRDQIDALLAAVQEAQGTQE